MRTDGVYGTLFLRSYAFGNKDGKATRLIGSFLDITEKKKLEEELEERKRMEQVKITEIALEAQERERNYLGQELHDNVNQILVSTKLLLGMIKDSPGNLHLVDSCLKNLQAAINENRKLSHALVTPDLSMDSLSEQLRMLTLEMFSSNSLAVRIDNKDFNETLLDHSRKITIYRIAQEQCTNIIKYAHAKTVTIKLGISGNSCFLRIADDGVGMEPGKASDGIGIRNIKGRVSIFGGNVRIETSPGKGFILEVDFQLS